MGWRGTRATIATATAWMTPLGHDFLFKKGRLLATWDRTLCCAEVMITISSVGGATHPGVCAQSPSATSRNDAQRSSASRHSMAPVGAAARVRPGQAQGRVIVPACRPTAREQIFRLPRPKRRCGACCEQGFENALLQVKLGT
jgi:hypothetical protein